MSRRDEILSRVKALPAMPVAALEVIRILQDPNADANQVRQAIEHDPGLTANVLRLANSAFFGGPKSIGSLREAVVRLGLKRIMRVVVASAAAPVVRVEVRGYDLPAGQLWEHSAAVAIATDFVAEAVGLRTPESAFTAGLLHDVGKIVLGTYVEVDAGPINSLAVGEKLSFDEAERRVLGVDHAEVGAVVLEAWKLPPAVVDAVRHHHSPPAGMSLSPTTDLVHAADALCMAEGLGMGRDGLNYRPSADVVKRLGLTTKINEIVLCRLLVGLEELRRSFGAGGGR